MTTTIYMIGNTVCEEKDITWIHQKAQQNVLTPSKKN